MATAGAASGAGCSEPPGRFECVLVDPVRNATVKIAVPREAGRVPTLGDVLSFLSLVRSRAARRGPTR